MLRAVLGKRQTEGELEATYQLMHDGMDLAEKEIRLAGNGQAARFIHELFAQAVTSDFEGSVRCTAPKDGRFSGVDLEMDAGNRVFTKLPVAPGSTMSCRERVETAKLWITSGNCD